MSEEITHQFPQNGYEAILVRLDSLDSRMTNLEEKVERKLMETRPIWEQVTQQLILLDRRFDTVDKRFDDIDLRFELIDQRFDGIDQRFEQIDQRFEQIDQRFNAVDKRFDEVDKGSTSWSCVSEKSNLVWSLLRIATVRSNARFTIWEGSFGTLSRRYSIHKMPAKILMNESRKLNRHPLKL